MAVAVNNLFLMISSSILIASRSVVVVSSLLDDKLKADFLDDINEQYAELREQHYESLEDRKYVTLQYARQNKFVIDWMNEPSPKKPSFLGTRVYRDYDLSTLLPYIDWNPFFSVWQLRGKYPNRAYPKIFNDDTVGQQAKSTHQDAINMLDDIIKNKLLTATAIVGFYPCASTDTDDIVIYKDDTRTDVLTTLHTLRQQAETLDRSMKYYAMSDFIAPQSSGVHDYIGIFAVSSGFGVDELVKEYMKTHDDYKSIMIKAVADRLAEALAEKLHMDIRRELWGYEDSSSSNTSPDELLQLKYDGIRPAPGYPSQPDHTEKQIIWSLMNIQQETGIELTESLAMVPTAAVSALVFANKHSSYFAVGKIGKDQVEDYANRKDMPLEKVEKWLSHSLNYDL